MAEDLAGVRMVGQSGDANVGIVVGTGTTKVTMDDYTLQAKVAHGGGAGQLNYGGGSLSAPEVNGNVITMRLERTFNNTSGADITVTEIGIMGASKLLNDNTDRYYLMSRDLLNVDANGVAQGITIPNGGSYKFRLKFQAQA